MTGQSVEEDPTVYAALQSGAVIASKKIQVREIQGFNHSS